MRQHRKRRLLRAALAALFMLAIPARLLHRRYVPTGRRVTQAYWSGGGCEL
jgi:hypothetical protein